MRILKNERGSIIVMAALIFVVIVAAGAGSIDIMRLTYENARQQEIVDFAALSGADKLGEGKDENAAKLVAKAILDSNEDIAEYTIMSIDVDFPYVTVEVEKPLDTYFLGLIGLDTLDSKVRAKAKITFISGGTVLPFGIPVGLGEDHPSGGIDFGSPVPQNTELKLMWDCDRDNHEICPGDPNFDVKTNFNYGFIGIDPDTVYNDESSVRNSTSDDTDSRNALLGTSRDISIGEYLASDPRSFSTDPPGNKGPIENWNRVECKDKHAIPSCDETLQELVNANNGEFTNSSSAITKTSEQGTKYSVLENGMNARINDPSCPPADENNTIHTTDSIIDSLSRDCNALVLVPLYQPVVYTEFSHPNIGEGERYEVVKVIGFAHVLITDIDSNGNITAVTTETLWMNGELGGDPKAYGGSCAQDDDSCYFYGEGRAILVE